MIIEKVLNNNAVTVIDAKTGIEKVVMGNGIGFKKKRGALIDEKSIEKIFQIEDKKDRLRFQQLINEIPKDYFEASEEIIAHAKEKLKRELNEHIFIALTDHLAFAIKRSLSGIDIKNTLLWEIKRIHKVEYDIGVWAVKYIKDRFKVDMPEDEAGFIALHLVTASEGAVMEDTKKRIELVQGMLTLIRLFFSMDIKEEDLAYDRLVTHLKYFARRIVAGEVIQSDDDELLQLIKDKYKKQYECAQKIGAYVKKNYDYDVSDSELIYLSLHLNRITSNIIE